MCSKCLCYRLWVVLVQNHFRNEAYFAVFFLDPDLFFFLRCSQMEKGTWSSGFPLCGAAKLARVLPVASPLLFSL